MPRRLFHPIDVSVFARLPQRVLRLGHTTGQCAHTGECPVTGAIRHLHAAPDTKWVTDITYIRTADYSGVIVGWNMNG